MHAIICCGIEPRYIIYISIAIVVDAITGNFAGIIPDIFSEIFVIDLKTIIDNGTLTLDLSEKGIYLKNDCFVSLEWIKDFGKSGLMFSAGFFNADSYSRKISQGDWRKVPVGLGFWSTVVHEI